MLISLLKAEAYNCVSLSSVDTKKQVNSANMKSVFYLIGEFPSQISN